MNAIDQRSRQADVKPTIVLVHGAFADASSWNGVVERLQQEVTPSNPLRGVAADSACAARLRQIDGPVLLAGHSYGGVVITNAATSAPNVVGLVLCRGLRPDEGENLGTSRPSAVSFDGQAQQRSRRADPQCRARPELA